MNIPLGLLLTLSPFAAQNTNDTAEAHVELARAAAGADFQGLLDFQCFGPGPGGNRGGQAAAAPGGQGRGRGGAGRGGGRGQAGPPARETWYAEPVQVFDNLYFVGQSEYAAWAVTTSEGIILIDTLFDYSVEEEVVRGLETLGLDPADIRYAIVSHPHPDHDGGARFLQEQYGTRVIMSPADWDVLDQRTTGTKPTRDMEATDGQRLTLGDTTLTLYITPGHTPGTISTLVPVRDNGTPHLAALWGGVGLNNNRESVETYIASAERFSDIVREAGVDVVLSNHTDWDRSKINLPLLANRAAGSPNPYVVGNEKVLNFMEVARECATSRIVGLE
jgi:metallo-beta-lactamase class B